MTYLICKREYFSVELNVYFRINGGAAVPCLFEPYAFGKENELYRGEECTQLPTEEEIMAFISEIVG